MMKLCRPLGHAARGGAIFCLLVCVARTVHAGSDQTTYSQEVFAKIHKPELAQAVHKRGKTILLDGSEYTSPNLDEFGQWRHRFIKEQLKLSPGGLDAGQAGDMDCFVMERRFSLMNPGGAFTFYLRVSDDWEELPLTIEVAYQGSGKTRFVSSIKTLGLFFDGVLYQKFMEGRGEDFELRRAYVGVVADPAKGVGGLHRLTLADLSGPEENTVPEPGLGWGLIDAIRIGAPVEVEVVGIANNFDMAIADERPSVLLVDHTIDTRLDWRMASHRPDPTDVLAHFRKRGALAGYNLMDRMFYHSFLDRDYPGSLHIFLANRSSEAVEIKRVLMGGMSLEEARFRGEVVWHRIWPNPVQPQRISQITIRLHRRPPMDPVPVHVVTSDGRMVRGEVAMDTQDPGFRYVGLGPGLNQVHAYVSLRPREDIEAVFVEGNEVSKTAVTKPIDVSSSRVAYVKADLERTWSRGEPLTVEVRTSWGRTAAAQVRAFAALFGRGVYGNLNSALEKAEPMALNMHWATSNYAPEPSHFELADKKGVGLISVNREWQKSVPSSLFGFYLADEVDWHDNIAGQEPGYLAQWYEETRAAPWREQYPSILLTQMLAENLSPASFFAWGQFSDVTGTDRYIIKNEREDMFLIYYHSLAARRAFAPHPAIIALQGYRKGRLPTAQEMRFMAYLAVAAGGKGLTYWALFPGLKKYMQEPQIDAISHVHHELASIEQQLALSYPVDMVNQVSPSGVFVKTLLAGESGVAVVALNRHYTRPPYELLTRRDDDTDAAKFESVQNVAIRLRLPEWLKPESAVALNGQSTAEVNMTSEGHDTVIHLDVLEVAQLIWIKNRG